MKKSTILVAYRMCEEEKVRCIRRRGTSFGITVETDAEAIYWQKRDRQSQYFWNRVYSILSYMDFGRISYANSNLNTLQGGV